MDILDLGVNMGVVGGIIAMSNWVKGFDLEGKYARFYPLIPFALGIVAALFKTVPMSWQGVGENALIYAGISSYIFKAGKTTILGK